MKVLFRLSIFILVVIALTSGCATTPEARIRKYPELFESFPIEARENVRAGRVEIGYTPDMAMLAFGRPHLKARRETADAVREIWIYEGVYFTAATYEARFFERGITMDQVVMIDHTDARRYARLRLEFENGRLVAIKQVDR